jgi:hypothetical protein
MGVRSTRRRGGSPASKAGLIVAIVTFAAFVIFTAITGSVFPYLNVGLVVVATVCVWLAFRPTIELRSRWVIAGFAVVFVAFRMYLFTVTPSVLGIDPHKFVIVIEQVLQRGAVDPISNPFYRNAPLFNVFGAVVMRILGLDPVYGMFVYTACSALIVVAAATWAHKLTGKPADGSTLLLAIALLSIATVNSHYFHWPIPQAMAVGLGLLYLSTLNSMYTTAITRVIPVLTVLSAAIVLTHKAGQFFIVAASVLWLPFIYVRERLDTERFHPAVDSRPGILKHAGVHLVLATLFLLIQWFIITRFGIFVSIGFIEAVVAPVGRTVVVEPTHAVPPIGDVYARFLYRWIGIVLFLIGAGISWLYLMARYLRDLPNRRRQELILAAATAVVGLLGAAFLYPGIAPPFRIALLTESVVVPLVIVGLAAVYDRFREGPHTRQIKRTAGGIGVLLLVVSSSMVGPVAPDSPYEPRYYVDTEEVAANDFRAGHVDEPVNTDWYYAQTVTPRGAARTATTGRAGSAALRDASIPIVNGNLSILEERAILVRRDVRVYRTRTGKWDLTYPYRDRVAMRNGRVYQSGSVELYAPRRDTAG